jgi:hypothetical protein
MKKSLTLPAAIVALTMTCASSVALQMPQTAFDGIRLPIVSVKATQHKMRSAGFLKTALEKKGVTVTSARREGQIYLFLVEADGTTAIVAIDGYSSEIVGVSVLTYGAGKTERPANSAGTHFVDFSYEFGYIVEESVYASYTEVTVEEYSSTEEYTEVSYEESEEVSYEEVTYDETTMEDEADLDQGDDGDQAGDDEADIQDNADEPEDAGTSDDGGDDSGDGGDDGADDEG